MPTITNRDVWGHIVKYLRISLSDDSAEEVKIKRRTLLSIALACSELTTVAVSELWRSIKTLEPIIYAFNPPPFQASPAAFEYKRVFCADYWEMVHASGYLIEDVKLRVLDYLSHVQYFHFPVPPSSKERTLWLALLAFNWINPLCPNLRGITFTGGNNDPSIAYHLVPFLVPSVRSIRFDSATTSRDEAAVSALLDLIKLRDIQISDIVYAGYASRRIVKHIFQFPKLCSAKVLDAVRSNVFLDTSDAQFFRPSTLLTSLDIDLGMFLPTFKVGCWIKTLQSLSFLSLRGTASVVIDCLQDWSFALVHSLTLSLRQPNRSPSVAPNIFIIIFAAFPTLHSLCLENKENYNIMNAAITLSDIHALRERPMRCLVVCCLRLSLSSSDVISIVNTWPSLERLSLVPDSNSNTGFERYPANVLLPYISSYAPHLTDLNLPLNMSSLITAQPLIAKTIGCPLQQLELTQVQNLPSGLEEKLMLVQNLVTLFPRVNVVTSNPNVRELQMIVKSFRRILSSPPKRSDNLY